MTEAESVTRFTNQLKRGKSVEDLDRRVEAWFRAKMPNVQNLELVSINQTSGEAGRSAEIFIVELRWVTTDQETIQKKYVLRAEANEPNNVFANSPHMIASLKVIGRQTDLPMPEVLWAEYDSNVLGGPFCVMEFLEGTVAPDSPPFPIAGWVKDATKENQEKMYRTGIDFLVRLHKLDWEQLGLDFLLSNTHGVTHTETLLNETISIYDQIVEGNRREFEQTTIEWLKSNLPLNENLCISWGDARPGNMLWKDFEMSAALDWEMITLLDPAYDVGLWLYSDYIFSVGAGFDKLPGMLDREQFVAEYERRSGEPLENFDYFEVFTAFRSHVNISNMIKLWERNGQHLFGEGINIDNSSTRQSYIDIASPHF